MAAAAHPATAGPACSFASLGRNVLGSWPRACVAASLALALALSAGLLRLRGGLSLRDAYTARGSLAEKEWLAFRHFYVHGEPYHMALYVYKPRPQYEDGRHSAYGSLLTERDLRLLVGLDEHVGTRCAGVRFDALCEPCHSNAPVRAFQKAYGRQASRIRRGLPPSPAYHLDYPTMRILHRRVDMRPHFFGADTTSGGNGTSAAAALGNVRRLPLVLLHYRAVVRNGSVRAALERWEAGVHDCAHDYLRSRNATGRLLAVAYGDRALAAELLRAATANAPYIGAGVAAAAVFVVCAVFTAGLKGAGRLRLLGVAAAALGSPALAIAAGFGALGWMGFSITSIVVVVPFLVLAVGIDDAFLLMHAWRRQQRHSHPSPAHRLAASLSAAGAGVCVTSATNAAAFAVGAAVTPIPDVAVFGVAAATCVAVDWLLQIMLFTPAMFMLLRGAHRDDSDEIAVTAAAGRCPPCARPESSKRPVDVVGVYSRLLCGPPTQLAAGVAAVALWSLSIYGVYHIRVDMTPQHLFLPDSYVHALYDLRARYVLSERFELHAIVRCPFAANDTVGRRRFWSFAGELAAAPLAAPNSSRVWLGDYEGLLSANPEFLRRGEGAPFDFAALPEFVQFNDFAQWRPYVNFHERSDGSVSLDSFMFSVAYGGAADWLTRADIVHNARRVAAKHGDLCAVVFTPDNYLVDQMRTLKPTSLGAALVTFIAMALVCAAFVRRPFAVALAAAAVASVCLGVVGGLYWWGVPLDPLAAGTVLMAVGFSVDFTAHVVHRYSRAAGLFATAEARVRHTVDALARPTIYAGASTLLVASALWPAGSYIGDVFAKTVTLVVLIGLAHGLFLVPVAFAAADQFYTWLRRRCEGGSERTVSA